MQIQEKVAIVLTGIVSLFTCSALAQEPTVVLTIVGLQKSFWTIRNPQPERWVLHATNPSSGDSLDIYEIQKQGSFKVSVFTPHSDSLTLQWPPGQRSIDSVSVFLSRDSVGFAGICVGRASDSSGVVKCWLDPKLPDCQYYLFAIRDSAHVIQQAYASETISLGKNSLIAPMFRYFTLPDPNGGVIVTFAWDSVMSPRTSIVFIKRILHSSKVGDDDSVVVVAGSDAHSASCHLNNLNDVSFRSQAADSAGGHSCWSEAIKTTGIK